MSKFKTIYDEELKAVSGGEGEEAVMVECKVCGCHFNYHSAEEKFVGETSEDKRSSWMVSLLKCPQCNDFREWKLADDSMRILS